MAVTPTSRENLPLKHVRAVLSNCATFQAWCGVANAAAALTRIHYVSVDPKKVSRPLAIVGFQDEAGLTGIEVAATSYLNYSGGVPVRIEGPVDQSLSEADRMLDYTNKTGAILSEFEAAARNYGFRLSGIQRVAGPMLVSDKEKSSRGNFGVTLYLIEYRD